MTYSEVWTKLGEMLGSAATYQLAVEAWHHGGDTPYMTLRWSVWLAGPLHRVTAVTPQALLDELRVHLATPGAIEARIAEVGAPEGSTDEHP